MSTDVAALAALDVEPGTLPETMAAWAIRQEREGIPTDAFQLEEIEVPEPGPFEAIVRLMAAGVNYNNVWASLGQPVSVFGFGDPEYGHHIGGSDASDIVFEHVGRETFPTSVLTVKPFGKVVICGATSGYQLDFDVRYLWMRQKQIIGSHFANAYECMKANQLMIEGKIRPVLWRTMEFEGVPAAHQLLYENKHLGKISVLVGAESEDEGRNVDGPGAVRV